jgi:hypothetical protein
MDLDAERVARNDATFREANERIEEAAAEHGLDERIPFICECAEPTCTELVQLSIVEYEAIRERSRWFLNVPGHEVAGGKHVRVVENRSSYVVVEKVGRAGEIAEKLDARDAESADARG